MGVNVSPEVLSAANLKNLAAKAELDRNISKEDLAEVHRTAKDEIDKLHKALTSSDASDKNSILDEHMADADTRKKLLDLINEVRATQAPTGVVGGAGGQVDKGNERTSDSLKRVGDAAGYARIKVGEVFGNPGDAHYKEYLSTIRRAIAKIPGYEPSAQHDIADAIYQSRDFNMKFISWLEGEAQKNTNSLDTTALGSGMWPFAFEKTAFDSVEEKRKVIQSMLTGLGDALKKPETQAGMIESFLGEGVIKTVAVTIGGTLATGVIAGVLVWKGGKWILGKALGATGAVIASAIGSMVGKGVSLGARGVKAGAAVAAGVVRGHAAAGVTPAAGPSVTPTRELDMKKPFDRMVHENILREMYMQANAGAIPDATQIKDFAEDIKNGTASSGEIAEYNNRVARYTELGDRPVGDAKKMTQYDAQVERIVRGEKDPSKWNLVAKSKVNQAASVNATAMQTRLRQTIADAKTEKITVGNSAYEVTPAAKAPLEDIRNLEDQVRVQEEKITELKGKLKMLEDRLKDEKKYAQARHDLKTIDLQISTAESDYESAQSKAETEKSTHGESSSQYKTARKIALEKESEWTRLKEKRVTDKQTKTALEDKYIEIDRGLVVDADGKLTSSTTVEKINSTSVIGKHSSGIKNQIFIAEGEITRLTSEINARLVILHGINGKIPVTWVKTGINVSMPDGSLKRVTELKSLFETLVKAMVKK